MNDEQLVQIISQGIVDGANDGNTIGDHARGVLRALRANGVLPMWRPLPAPAMDRIIVAGWQKPTATVAGYWWFHEDDADSDGWPSERPHATHWFSLWGMIPPFPEAPQ